MRISNEKSAVEDPDDWGPGSSNQNVRRCYVPLIVCLLLSLLLVLLSLLFVFLAMGACLVRAQPQPMPGPSCPTLHMAELTSVLHAHAPLSSASCTRTFTRRCIALS